MKWQEYQDAVVEFYKKAKGIGQVCKNLTRPDKVTGQARQVDCWIEAPVKGHIVKILVDAKFRKGKVDVKDVEAVRELGEAVGADKCFLICPNGWTEPAMEKAEFIGLDLRLLTVKSAVQLLDIENWEICPNCQNDYILMEKSGSIELDGMVFWWLAGQCRECRSTLIWCQDCGDQMCVTTGQSQRCSCGHSWSVDKIGMHLRPHDIEGKWLIW